MLIDSQYVGNMKVVLTCLRCRTFHIRFCIGIKDEQEGIFSLPSFTHVRKNAASSCRPKRFVIQYLVMVYSETFAVTHDHVVLLSVVWQDWHVQRAHKLLEPLPPVLYNKVP